MSLKVALLAGGVGGAKMAEGFQALIDVDLTVIGNVADDAEFHGLWVSPDIDTLTYSLAGLIDRQQGWGVADEGLRGLGMLERLGAETWMTLGDQDLGLHIYRTQRRHAGDRPRDIARDIAARLGVTASIVLPTDDVVQTRVRTDEGWLGFQEYFVRERCAPAVLELSYDGATSARPTAEALSAIADAHLIVLAPSNPLVSIAPILAIPGIRSAILAARAPVVAVSPLIGGAALKGPAASMMTSLGLRADVLGVAEQYSDLADALFIDPTDIDFADAISRIGMRPLETDILMPDQAAKTRLARTILDEFKGGMIGVAA